MKFFTARYVRFEIEDQLISLGFFDDESDPIDYLLLSRSESSTELLLLINDTDQEFVQVIDKVELQDDDLWLTINIEAIEALDYATIHIQIENLDRELKAQLKQLFANTSVRLSV